MPECSIVSGHEGGPAIVVDGQTFAPLFFCGNNAFGRDEVLIETLELAANADIPFYVFNLQLPWDGDFSGIDETIEKFHTAHPAGYFYVRVWVGASQAWLKEHPDQRLAYADGSTHNMASPGSGAWRETARERLVALVQHIVDGPHGGGFIGMGLQHLETAEWFYPRTNDFSDYAPPNTDAFRDWLRKKYRKPAQLQNAWGDPEVTFDTAEIPAPDRRLETAWGPFRDPVRQRAAMDLQQFQSAQIVADIAYFARAVKEATNGHALVGAFYGYTFQLNHNAPRALANSGHLALAGLLALDCLDIVQAPYAYFERELGQPGHFHLPVDSVALHGKLAIMEDDTYTHLAIPPDEGLAAPGYKNRLASAEETYAIVRRNAANFLSHRCGFWFFDLLSDGRWNDNALWESAALLRRIAAELRSQPPFAPGVAFVVSERSVHTLGANTHPWLLESLGRWRHEIARLGAPAGYYLQSDLTRLPDSVRLVILANPYILTKAEHKALERITARGGTVVYTYAAGAWSPEHGIDLARIQDHTGFRVAARWDRAARTAEFANSDKPTPIDLNNWLPRLIIVDLPEGATPLARYLPTENTAMAIRPEGNGHVVYSALPRVPVGLMRTLCKQAGVHLYRDPPGMVGVAGPYLITHTATPEPAPDLTLHWPAPVGGVRRLVPLSRYPIPVSEHTWQDILPPGISGVYRITPQPVE
ncbi:MAG: beta-galactosidase [Candidatus Hydrogenedentota bacterium]